MPKRMVHESVVLVRDNNRVVPEVGQSFNFHQSEIDSINAVRPEAIRRVVADDIEIVEDNQDPAPNGKTLTAAEKKAAKDAAKVAGEAGSQNGGGKLDDEDEDL